MTNILQNITKFRILFLFWNDYNYKCIDIYIYSLFSQMFSARQSIFRLFFFSILNLLFLSRIPFQSHFAADVACSMVWLRCSGECNAGSWWCHHGGTCQMRMSLVCLHLRRRSGCGEWCGQHVDYRHQKHAANEKITRFVDLIAFTTLFHLPLLRSNTQQLSWKEKEKYENAIQLYRMKR